MRQVEKLSEVHSERISNSYLAYCETGRLLPSLGKLMTLSRVLGIPLQNFTERLELDREAVPPVDLGPDGTWRQMRQAGIAEAEAGELQRAYACFQAALEMARASADAGHDAACELRMDMAVVLKRMSRHHTARDILEEIISDRNTRSRSGGNDPDPMERALLQLGGVLREMGKLPLAAMVAREALARAEAAGSEAREGHAACLLGNALFDLEDYDRASPLYHRAIRIFRDLEDLPSLTCNLANLGNCLVAQGQHTEGIRKLREAESIAAREGFKRHQADIGCYLGQAWRREGNLPRAERAFFQSNAHAREGEFHDILFSNTWHLREMALKEGRAAEAADHLRSLRFFRTRVENTNAEIRAYDRMTDGDRLNDNGDAKGMPA